MRNVWVPVKNVKDVKMCPTFRLVFSLQVSWQILKSDTILLDQRQRLYYSQHSQQHDFYICPCALGTDDMEGTGRGRFYRGLLSQLRSHGFRKPESFIMVSKQTCLTFVLERAIILSLQDSKQICPQFPWETQSSKAVYSWAISILCYQYVKKQERPMEIQLLMHLLCTRDGANLR